MEKTTELATNEEITAVERALMSGDLSKLEPDQRLNYYNQVCESLSLNPLTRPFEYITLNGKLTLYAKRDATDQLRRNHQISIKIASRELVGDVYVVQAYAQTPDGRFDESVGAVHVGTLKGEALANAYMKAETKAKRRVALSICGLGWLDENEVESIPNVKTGTKATKAHQPIDAEFHEHQPAPQLAAPIPDAIKLEILKLGYEPVSINKRAVDVFGCPLSELDDEQIDGILEKLRANPKNKQPEPAQEEAL